MKILIIGSEGFIGKHCVDYFVKKGLDVFGCDLINVTSESYTYIKVSRIQPDYSKLFSQHNFDFIICAGGNGSVPISFSSPLMDFEANVSDVLMLLNYVKEHNSNSKFINISSAAVYGNPQTLPVSEDSIIAPMSPYGWHKYMSELACKEYYELFNVKTCSIRPFSVYGPGLKKQIIWDIYQKFIHNGIAIELYGTGEETRDFIFIEDLVASIDLIIEKSDFKGEIYNLASGHSINIKNLASLLLQEIGFTGELKFNNEIRQGDPRFWLADISKIKTLG
jgi:UDP-glucose 4-epimerase